MATDIFFLQLTPEQRSMMTQQMMNNMNPDQRKALEARLQEQMVLLPADQRESFRKYVRIQQQDISIVNECLNIQMDQQNFFLLCIQIKSTDNGQVEKELGIVIPEIASETTYALYDEEEGTSEKSKTATPFGLQPDQVEALRSQLDAEFRKAAQVQTKC